MGIKRGKVYWVDLPLNKASHIQGGGRPCVIVSSDTVHKHSGVITVCPLSTKLDDFPFHPKVFVCGKPGQILCDQITTIDKAQLGDYKDTLTLPEISAMETALDLVLGMLDGTL